MTGKRVVWGMIIVSTFYLLFGTCSLGTDIDTLRGNVTNKTAYTVSFNSNGGSNVPSQTVYSGGTARRPTNPTRSGYTFDNWYRNSGLITVYDFSTPVTGDITLYAKWNRVSGVTYTVSFDSNGGNIIAPQTVNSGGTATRPAPPDRSGYTFDNWYTTSALTTVYNFSTPVTGNITLYAKWTPGGPTLDLARAEKVSLANAWYAVYRFVLPAGKTWADYKGLSADYMFTEEELYNATARNGRLMGPYELSDFDLYFGEGNAYGKNLAIANYNAGKNAGYILDGGKLGNDGSPGSLVIELAARAFINAEGGKWFTIDYYDITGGNKNSAYDMNHYPADDATGPFYFGIGLPGSFPDIPPNNYYIRDVKLIGYNASDTVIATPLWFRQDGNLFPAFTGYPSVSGADGFAAATRVMADGSQPTPVPWDSATYTVSFESDGGSSVSSQTVSSGSTADRPANPTKNGYTFNNWYTTSALTMVYDFSTAVTGNITLYAKWIPIVISPTGIEMVYVPGGSFEMGDVKNEGYDDSEKPVHTVTLNGFYMGKYQVTQEQYEAVMEGNPSSFSSTPASEEVQGKRPVENVSWYDAVVFCNRLSVKEGLSPAYSINGNTDPFVWGTVPTSSNSTWNAAVIVTGSTGYRLPTEAQWEYAAKGGNGSPGNYTYSGSDTVDDVAWYGDNSNGMTHEVGKKAPNGLAIYDMSGNVWEWCWDWYGSYMSEAQTDPVGPSNSAGRVLRGGRWGDSAVHTRSACRGSYYPDSRSNMFGFRLVRPSDTASGFTSIAEFAAWLSAQPENTAATAYNVKLNVNNLGGSASTSGSLGYVLNANPTKYVNLDLSGSTFTSIWRDTFSGCTSLVSITIPNSVTSIGWQAFEDCTGLTSVTIPDSVTSIWNAAFSGCTSLASITIPNSVTSIEYYAFYGCTSLTSVTIPDSITSIVGTFRDCTSLANVTIGNSVTSIGEQTFYNCKSLTSVTIPNSVTSIGGGAFYSCNSLTSVTFQGTIASENFTSSTPFLGDLRAKYLATGGGIGTYKTTAPVRDDSVWTKQ